MLIPLKHRKFDETPDAAEAKVLMEDNQSQTLIGVANHALWSIVGSRWEKPFNCGLHSFVLVR